MPSWYNGPIDVDEIRGLGIFVLQRAAAAAIAVNTAKLSNFRVLTPRVRVASVSKLFEVVAMQ